MIQLDWVVKRTHTNPDIWEGHRTNDGAPMLIRYGEDQLVSHGDETKIVWRGWVDGMSDANMILKMHHAGYVVGVDYKFGDDE